MIAIGIVLQIPEHDEGMREPASPSATPGPCAQDELAGVGREGIRADPGEIRTTGHDGAVPFVLMGRRSVSRGRGTAAAVATTMTEGG